MITGNLMNNTKTRRKGSMLQDNLSKIKYLFVLAVLLVLPMQATVSFAGSSTIIDQTDTGVNRLVYFFDTRDRDTFIQVTNTSTAKINIHVQVFDAGSLFVECEECNFDDMLTPNDTHVYDVENMMTNSGPLLPASKDVCTEIGPDTCGFVVISVTNFKDQGAFNSLIGMFRIIDESGYEYRANAAGPEDGNFFPAHNEVVNFSAANGHNLSDLVGITYISVDSATVYASPQVATVFGSPFDEILIYDQDEDDISCSPTFFACAVGALDRGIDNALPNSKGEANRVCSSSILNSNSSGWLDLPLVAFSCAGDPFFANPDGSCSNEPWFVGFIGLNNGNGTGSMDSYWEKSFRF